jgi:hypothetical protein
MIYCNNGTFVCFFTVTAFPEGLGKAGIGGAIGGQDELFGG